VTPLGEILETAISSAGPLRLDQYIEACLSHPQYGYYATRDPFGAAGDFVTAPEISQMFGELLGLCLAQSWVDQGRPGRFALTELGPGRGTLMADILRATAVVPGFHDAAKVHLVETSPALRDAQRERLAQAIWHDSVTDLPDLPLFLVANEFFDALPVRQFQRVGDSWRERMVGPGLKTQFGPPTPVPQLSARLDDTPDGRIVELRPQADDIVETISGHIAQNGGAALIVDYGDWRSLGDTLQAVRDHAFEDPFANPGQADVTAHVDFEPIARLARSNGVAVSGLTAQGVLLERLGITPRAQALAENLTGMALDAHIAAHRRLTHPEKMGQLFKALALYADGSTCPPGFDP